MTDEVVERIEVDRAIAADPAAIFAVLRNPSGHVSIDASGMLMSSSDGPVGGVGDSFVMHMDRDALRDFAIGEYDVTITIVAYDENREIAWTVGTQPSHSVGHVYGYRLDPIDGGTLVTQYYDWSGLGDDVKAMGIFPVIPETALRATLGILARTVAPGLPRPGVSASERAS